MKDSLIIACGLFLVLGIGVWSFFRSNEEDTEKSTRGNVASEETGENFQKISIEELRDIVLEKKKSEETTVIETRPSSLWSDEHVIGSKSLPYEEANGSFHPTDAEKTRDWMIVAPDSASAGRLAALLLSRGVPRERIKILNGTYETWKEKTGLITKRADPSSPVDVTKVTFVSPETAKQKINQGGQWFILDVRSPNRFAEDHIARAINIPFSEIEEKRWEIPGTAPLLVYGEDDRESFAGGVLLFDLGFFDTLTLSAGFDELKTKGLPTTKP